MFILGIHAMLLQLPFYIVVNQSVMQDLGLKEWVNQNAGWLLFSM